MPITPCPSCGKDVQFPDYFHGNEISCPNPACQKPVLLPYADGTFPVKAPPTPTKPPPAAAYYLRKPDAPDLVIGPLPRQRVRQMALQKKLSPTDQLSEDRSRWRPAMNCDPDLFKPQPHCNECGAALREDIELCPACARKPKEERGAAGTYGVSGGPGSRVRAMTGTVESLFTAPEPLADFVSAHGADAFLGAGVDGWLGLWSCTNAKPIRSWAFTPGPRTRLAVAHRGGLAVVATGSHKATRLLLVDFESRKLHELTELEGEVQALGLDPSGKYLAIVDDRPDVRIYKVDPWKRLDKFPVEGERFELCLAADRLAAGSEDGTIEVWNLRTGRVERELLSPGRYPGCPHRPLRLGFSRTGKRLFAAAGLIVHFPKRTVEGIGERKAFVIGAVAGGLLGGITAAVINNNVPVMWEKFRLAKEASLERDLAQGTALRAWELDGGGLLADMWCVFQYHPTGIADTFFYPFGTAAVTVDETAAHAWDLTSGGYQGPICSLTDAAEIERAKRAVRPDLTALPADPSLIRRVDFTADGEHVLVQAWGDRHVRMIAWPKPGAADAELHSELGVPR
jgi:hypothetical protein